MSYPDVKIHNSTQYPIDGTVEYMSIFCKNDDFHIDPGYDWSHSRGVCLITKITAVVTAPSGPVPAKPYESSGTSYSQFAVISVGPNSYEVTRRVNGAEDEPPEDYEEPTTEQK